MLTKAILVRELEHRLDYDKLSQFNWLRDGTSTEFDEVLDDIWHPLRRINGDYNYFLVNDNRWSKNVD